MKKYAVIDIGSNSVRLMIVADGKVLYKTLETTRLGEGLASCPRLKAEAIERSANAVANFYRRAINEGAETVLAFATAAARTAENGDKFVERVKTLCGLTVEIIAGETEAEIGILGALGFNDGTLIDIGGASTEIVVQKNKRTVYKKSVDIGVVRLKDGCGRDKEKLLSTMRTAEKEYGDIVLQGQAYAIGGTATTVAAQILGLTEYKSDKITGAEIRLKQVQVLADKLLKMPIEEIADLPCMPKGRADVIAGGALWLARIMERFSIQTLIVSDRDNLEGYAIKKGFEV